MYPFVAALLLASAAFVPPLHAQSRFESGELKGFTQVPLEQIIIRQEGPIVVRSVQGAILSGADKGAIPETIEVLFEIRGPGASEVVRGVLADNKGRFKLRHVKPGLYKFKASANGFRSIVGTLIVTRKAPPENEIRLRLPLGV